MGGSERGGGGDVLWVGMEWMGRGNDIPGGRENRGARVKSGWFELKLSDCFWELEYL